MNCPSCGSDRSVVIKYTNKGNKILREYGCNCCEERFKTIETIDSKNIKSK